MLNFKEELKKYQPLMELDDIQSALQPSQMQDLLDILQHIAKENKSQDTSASQAEES